MPLPQIQNDKCDNENLQHKINNLLNKETVII